MSKDNLIDKLKEGVSVNELEGFANKHMTELFSILAIIIGAFSSSYDFFTGPKLTIFCLSIGALVAILSPAPIDRGIRQIYKFAFQKEKTMEIVLGIVKIIVAIFIPFLFFGFLGLLAGTSYHYYIKQAQMGEHHPPPSHRHESEDEHD